MKTARLESLAQTAVLALFLVLPLAGQLIGLGRAKELARESSVERPDLPGKPSELRAFTGAFERYYDRHFGWRNRLARGYHQLSYLLFRFSELPQAITGRDGWLFLADSALKYQRANRPFTERELSAWVETLAQRSRFFADHGIAYLFMVVPNKHTLYPEHLPWKAKRSGPVSRYEQLLPALRARGVDVLDLHEPFLEQRDRQLYLPTASHWNQRGVYVAYRELVARLAQDHPTIEPIPWDRIEFAEVSQPTLTKMFGFEGILPQREERVSRGLRHIGHLHYEMRADDLVTETPDALALRVVLYHDSFGPYLQPYLSEHFQWMSYRWQTTVSAPYVCGNDVQLVIEERVERTLMGEPPRFELPASKSLGVCAGASPATLAIASPQ